MSSHEKYLVGFGVSHPSVIIYIANRPSIDDYPVLNTMLALAPGEIDHIVRHTSNHWRKVFNVLAKFLVELRFDEDASVQWQSYRDSTLLQSHSDEALLFSPPKFSELLHSDVDTNSPSRTVHIVVGKAYATNLKLPCTLTWLDSHFAVNNEHRVIVSPYPDYRQLSNARISQLVALVKGFC